MIYDLEFEFATMSISSGGLIFRDLIIFLVKSSGQGVKMPSIGQSCRMRNLFLTFLYTYSLIIVKYDVKGLRRGGGCSL